MKPLRVYSYAKWGTYRKALKWLDDRGLDYKVIDIVDHPPSESVLRRVLPTDVQTGWEIRESVTTQRRRFGPIAHADG